MFVIEHRIFVCIYSWNIMRIGSDSNWAITTKFACRKLTASFKKLLREKVPLSKSSSASSTSSKYVHSKMLSR